MKRQLTIVSRYMAMSILVCSFAACSDDNPKPGTGDEKELSEEYYSGGKLGTTFNSRRLPMRTRLSLLRKAV